MKSKFVKINGINELKSFIDNTTNVDGDVVCKRGKFIIDGKSIMGLMSIDIADGFTVEYPDDAVEFDKFLESF